MKEQLQVQNKLNYTRLCTINASWTNVKRRVNKIDQRTDTILLFPTNYIIKDHNNKYRLLTLWSFVGIDYFDIMTTYYRLIEKAIKSPWNNSLNHFSIALNRIHIASHPFCSMFYYEIEQWIIYFLTHSFIPFLE